MAKVTSNVKNTVAKKVEEAVKPVAKAVETKVEEVKAEAVKAEAKVEEAVKPVVEKAAPEKEAKKPGRKPGLKNKSAAKPAKKEEAVTEIYVQYGPGESSVATVVEKIKAEYVEQGHRASSIKS